MKKLLVALALATTAASASAATLSVTNGVNVTISGFGTNPAPYTSGVVGNLVANYNGSFTAQYLGSDSGFNNFYVGGSALTPTLTEGTLLARATTTMVAGQRLDFGFGEVGQAPGIYSNLNTNVVANRSFVILANYLGLTDSVSGKTFDFLVGYNDSGWSLRPDYNDYLVGISSVPVPAALPLLASAFAAFGIARRKNKQA